MGHRIEDLAAPAAEGAAPPHGHEYHEVKSKAKRLVDLYKDANYAELDKYLKSDDGAEFAERLCSIGKRQRQERVVSCRRGVVGEVLDYAHEVLELTTKTRTNCCQLKWLLGQFAFSYSMRTRVHAVRNTL